MTQSHDALDVLNSLYILGQYTQAGTVGALAAKTGLSPTQVGSALVHLESRGLVDASRCRLTMMGLALSAATAAQRSTQHRAA